MHEMHVAIATFLHVTSLIIENYIHIAAIYLFGGVMFRLKFGEVAHNLYYQIIYFYSCMCGFFA